MKVDKHTVRYDVDKSLQLKEDVNPSQLTQKDLPWKHKRINDNDVDNDMISSLSWAYRNIIHEIADFELPPRPRPVGLKAWCRWATTLEPVVGHVVDILRVFIRQVEIVKCLLDVLL